MTICANCSRSERQHVMGRCPSPGTHVVIDADTVNRAVTTGHPRLLSNVLSGAQRSVLVAVNIDALRVNGTAVAL